MDDGFWIMFWIVLFGLFMVGSIGIDVIYWLHQGHPECLVADCIKVIGGMK